MKKIICEMCDGSNFLKQDGMYVCQECGAKYSVEEARKLMVEVGDDTPAAPAAVAAPAAPDNSQRVENLRKLAKRAKEEDNSEMAAKYYEQLLMECPDDWEASFYSTFYAAHNIKIAQIGSAANKVANIIGPTFKLIKQTCNEAEGMAAYIGIAADVIGFCNLLFSNITKNLGSTMEAANRNMDNWAVPAVSMLVVLGDKMRLEFPGEATDALALTVYNAAFGYSDVMKDRTSSTRTLHRNVSSRKNQLEQEKKAKEERKKKEARDAYWAAHAEEKAKLLAEKDELKAKLNNLRAEINRTKDHHRKQEEALQAQINQLSAQKASLGLFKGKEKKALQAQIDDLNVQIAQVRKSCGDAVAKLEGQVKSANARISAIDKELTKDR